LRRSCATRRRLLRALVHPNRDANGEESSPTTRHPFLTDTKVREAMTPAVDRQAIVAQLHGDGLTGLVTNNQADVPIISSSPDAGFPVQYTGRSSPGKDQDRNWAQKSNNRSGRSVMRWKSDEYDKLYDQVPVEPNLDKAATMWQQMNALIINNVTSVPLVDRTFSSGKAENLTGPAPRTFDWETWNIAEWKKG
jgi:ABC-type transport system substrate-binding protein